jgi:uncharacterized protein (DUF934 family)
MNILIDVSKLRAVCDIMKQDYGHIVLTGKTMFQMRADRHQLRLLTRNGISYMTADCHKQKGH